ncbi:Anaphase-promoting complex subunit 1 [Basidiobolus ranarum]|uniref:Anaphase-promoting complex subunit 1 n=1 Tax=Basidiobolus ranarum TaxID=34480 RepID=A0ABR2WZ81_9FUNG
MQTQYLGKFKPFGTTLSNVPTKKTAFPLDPTDLYFPTFSSLPFPPSPSNTYQLYEAKGGGEEEIYITRTSVIWSQGSLLRKKFTFPEELLPIRQAFWACFEEKKMSDILEADKIEQSAAQKQKHTLNEQKPDTNIDRNKQSQYPSNFRRVLFVLLRDTARVYFENGEAHIIHLPFPVAQVWPLSNGLLFQRSLDDKSHLARPELNHFPIFFTLLEPFEEMKYLTTRSDKTLPPPLIQDQPFTDMNHVVVFANDKPDNRPIIVTFSKLTKQHYIWTYNRFSESIDEKVPYLPNKKNRRESTLELERVWSGEPEQTSALSYSYTAQMKSPISLQLLWSEPSFSQADNVFICHDLKGNEVLCFLLKASGSLLGFDIDFSQKNLGKSKQVLRTEGIAAIPVKSIRKELVDILVLKANHTLQLQVAGQIELECTFSSDVLNSATPEMPCTPSRGHLAAPMFSSTPCSDSDIDMDVSMDISHDMSFNEEPSLFDAQQSLYVKSIQDEVSNRVNLVLSDSSMVRVALDFVPNSMLVRRCLEALSCALPTATYSNFLAHYLKLQYGNIAAEDFSSCDEWDMFIVNLLYFCQAQPASGMSVFEGVVKQDSDLHVDDNPVYDDKDDWEFLLDSEYHSKFQQNFGMYLSNSHLPNILKQQYASLYEKSRKVYTKYPMVSQFPSSLAQVLFALHLIYEDVKLSAITRPLTKTLCPLLIQLAMIIRWDNYIDYYRRDNDVEHYLQNDLCLQTPQEYEPIATSPPNIHQWVMDILSLKEISDFPLPHQIPGLFDQSDLDFVLNSNCCSQTRKICKLYRTLVTCKANPESLIKVMIEENFQHRNLDQLPFGISLPLREAIHYCRKKPSTNWPIDAYKLIGREDMAEQLRSNLSPPESSGKQLISQPSDIHSICQSVLPVQGLNGNETGAEITLNEIPMLRFCDDLRLKEVQRLLQSTKPVKLVISDLAETSEHEVSALQQGHIGVLSRRTYALPVGRGILTFGTFKPNLAEKYPIPGITVAAKIPPLNSVVALDTTLFPPEYEEWPSFHDGVAAGLRISQYCSEIDGSWIVYNRPDEPDSKHAGLLYALGLTGHLRRMVPWHSFSYLTHKHDMTSIGLLLGLSSAYCGTMDTTVTKLLAIHIPPLLPPDSSDIHLSPLTQAASLLGMGLVYLGTTHRRMVEVMLKEIGKKTTPSTEAHDLPESIALSAGVALGLITLGRGNDTVGLTDLHIVEELCRLMNGGRHLNKNGKPLGFGKCSEWKGNESAYINTDVTAPGATLALGLMYLRTHNQSVADKLKVPDNWSQLENIRPDFASLRIISRNLILWNFIEPTEEWIQQQIPSSIRVSFKNAPGSPAISLPHRESIKRFYYYIVAGACFSIGLKFAGSANETAFRCLLAKLDYFMSLSTGGPSAAFEENITRSTIKSCLDAVCTSVALVMAGTGNLEVMRRLRVLHGRVTPDVTYGNHMASHMALGLLFLGGGNFTLGRSNKAIAALVISLFPRYPKDPSDNRSHLQALRHLWVLAIEPRCLVTRDIDTREACHIPILVKLLQENGETSEHEMTTPCLLPDLKIVQSITINSPRYWPIVLDIAGNEFHAKSLSNNPTIFVKRKIGHLSYNEDPKGYRSILTQAFSKNLILSNLKGAPAVIEDMNFLKSFSADPQLQAFAQYFCDIQNDSTTPHGTSLTNTGPGGLSEFCRSVLYECVTKDKPEILHIYLALYHSLQSLRSRVESHSLWNTKIILHYYNSPSYQNLCEPLIQQEFRAYMENQLSDAFSVVDENSTLSQIIKQYYNCFEFPVNPQVALGYFRGYLIYNDIPNPQVLKQISELVKNQNQEDPKQTLLFLSLVLPRLPLNAVNSIVSLIC